MNDLKVLLVNGSPHEKGCVFTALNEIAESLKNSHVASDIFWLGNNPIAGCTGCQACLGRRECFRKDLVNDFVRLMDSYDGFVFGTPVHYAAASGAITSFLNRVFMIDEYNDNHFSGKPAAAIATCRRSGGSAALDQLNKYMLDCNMPIVPAHYWNIVHGNTPEEIRRDEEGLRTMRILGQNMAWLLQCIEAGRRDGILLPEYEPPVMTNFIR